MTLNEYKEAALKFRLPSANNLYIMLGLIGELGELYSKMAKGVRDRDDMEVDPKEIGDILWFIVMLCEDNDLDLDKILEENIDKLASRKARNMLQGSGDNR